MVQKVAEGTFPNGVFLSGTTPLPSDATILSITVVPNPAGIVHKSTLIRDKVVNIGLVPVTISVVALFGTPLVPTTFTFTTSLKFQEHTDCPGACPEDTVTESPLIVEGTFGQPGVPVVASATTVVTGILVKVILRTTITVTRPVIVDSKGGICDVNDRRCDLPTNPPTFTLPTTPTGP
ncbi:hypothetical protein [uncultured Psychrobacillus sp.]|uniref:hypothetical protein n=1 Tax=uncultured Psychrobacillus sp. TaxID=1551585 RepID=UPI00262718A8|nr:hypothetical protein [uncultured Psychrobacillus sp.]